MRRSDLGIPIAVTLIYQYGHGRPRDRSLATTSATAPLTDLAVLAPDHAATASLSQQAYYLLRDRIVTLALPPGSLVNERDLCQEFGLGRTPVREALHRLADDGLVEVWPRRGIYVGAVDVGDLRGISELRIELEGFAARLAAERITETDRTELTQLRSELDQVHDDADERHLIHLDQRIHRLIYRLARNAFLEAAADRAYVLALRLWFLALERVERLEDAVHDHQVLLDRIEQGDADHAAAVAREHVEDFERQIRQLL